MAKKSTKLEALQKVFQEHTISPDSIEWNDALIQKIKKKCRYDTRLPTLFLCQTSVRRYSYDCFLCLVRKCK